MGGRPIDAQAPTPPVSEPEEAEVRQEVGDCLNDLIDLVMHRHYRKELVDARRKKKRKEKKERKKYMKG